MPFNGSGVYTTPATDFPPVTHQGISSSKYINLINDIAAALNKTLCRDGQATVTANIPFAGFKLTGVGLGTVLTDAATLANLIGGTGLYVATVGGTVDAITLTPSPAITAYAAGQTFRFIASGANTTAATLQVSGLASPKAITKNGTTALAAGDIASGAMVTITYDGTRFILTATSTATLNSPTIITPTITTPTITTPAITGGTMTQVPITQNSQSAAYTTLLTDGGKHLLHPTADNNPRTFTIDSNANVAYPTGTVLTFVNQINVLSIAITSDTMTLAGTASTGTRTLAVNGIATALKIASTSWIISGTGLA